MGAKPHFSGRTAILNACITCLVSILFGAAAVLIVPFVTLYTHGVTDAANYDAPLLGMLIIAEAVTNHAKMPWT